MKKYVALLLLCGVLSAQTITTEDWKALYQDYQQTKFKLNEAGNQLKSAQFISTFGLALTVVGTAFILTTPVEDRFKDFFGSEQMIIGTSINIIGVAALVHGWMKINDAGNSLKIKD